MHVPWLFVRVINIVHLYDAIYLRLLDTPIKSFSET